MWIRTLAESSEFYRDNEGHRMKLEGKVALVTGAGRRGRQQSQRDLPLHQGGVPNHAETEVWENRKCSERDGDRGECGPGKLLRLKSGYHCADKNDGEGAGFARNHRQRGRAGVYSDS